MIAMSLRRQEGQGQHRGHDMIGVVMTTDNKLYLSYVFTNNEDFNRYRMFSYSDIRSDLILVIVVKMIAMSLRRQEGQGQHRGHDMIGVVMTTDNNLYLSYVFTNNEDFYRYRMFSYSDIRSDLILVIVVKMIAMSLRRQEGQGQHRGHDMIGVVMTTDNKLSILCVYQ